MAKQELVVAVDLDGLYHCALHKVRPSGGRRGKMSGRTLPASAWLESLCTREPKNLTAPTVTVDLTNRAEGVWCQECAGYLDHLDKAREAELAGGGINEAIALIAGGDVASQLAARNAASMARLGEQLTGQPQPDVDLAEWCRTNDDESYPYEQDQDDLAARRAARAELRRLSTEGEL